MKIRQIILFFIFTNGFIFSSCTSTKVTHKKNTFVTPNETEITEALENISVPNPTRKEPVSVAVSVYPKAAKKGQVVTILTKAKILNGWHIYAKVPKSKPFITSQLSFDLPDGLELIGDLKKPKPRLYPTDKSILVYKNEVYFTQNVKVVGNTIDALKIAANLYYQACDRNRCLTPKTKSTQTTITIKK